MGTIKGLDAGKSKGKDVGVSEGMGAADHIPFVCAGMGVLTGLGVSMWVWGLAREGADIGDQFPGQHGVVVIIEYWCLWSAWS